MPSNEQRGEAQVEDVRRPIPVVISEDTPVKMRFVFLIIGGIVSVLLAAFSAVWWAATVSEKLSTIVTQQAAIVAQAASFRDSYTQSTAAINARLSDLESWRKMIDQQGDPAGKVRDDNLQSQIIQLRHDFDVVQAQSKGKP